MISSIIICIYYITHIPISLISSHPSQFTHFIRSNQFNHSNQSNAAVHGAADARASHFFVQYKER